MHFLITNDDGIGAHGINALIEAARELGEVTVVAPDRHLSGCGHQTTTDRPLTATQVRPGEFAVDGTPADCVRVAVLKLVPKIDWVLSGINEGGNLGVDVYMSGTVAAAREAMLLGLPAIALSQYRKRGHAADWKRSTRWAIETISQLIRMQPPEHAFWNVNFPDGELLKEPDTLQCLLEPHPLPIAFDERDGSFIYRSNYHERPRADGSDVDCCFSGNIAITRVPHYRYLPK